MYILYALIVLRFGRVWSSPSSAFQFESSDTTVVRKAQDIIRLLLVLTAIDRSKKLESHSEAEPEKKEKGKTKEMEDDQSNHGNGKGNLDTAKADRSVWLMKCPLVVAKSWQNQASSQDSQPVAKVILSLDPLQSDSMQFTMETTAVSNDSLNRPKSYSLNMFKDFVPMSVFSESNQGKVAMEGKVEHKFDMKPHEKNMEEYGRLCRERTNKSMIKNRQIQVIDNDHGVHMRPMPGMVGLISSNSKDKKKAQPVKQTEVKRTRRDRGELEDIMFKLFERQPNWALKQLVQETDQPAQFLKEILNELCVYNKRGTNQGTYELKPEYKKSVEDGGAD